MQFALLFVVVVAIRTATGIVWFDDFRQDPDAYRNLAENWAKTGTFGLRDAAGNANPTAYRPPLYPWLLSWMVGSDGKLASWTVLAMHIIVGTVSCLMAGDVYRRIAGPTCWWPLLTLLMAVDPILVRQSSLIMTETIATLFGVVIWWVWIQPAKVSANRDDRDSPNLSLPQAVALGLLLGANVLCRPTGLVWAGLLVLFVLMFVRSGTIIKRLAWSAALVVVIVSVVTPWAIRNQRFLGQRVWLTTHGGYTLLLANNPLLYDHFRREGFSRDWNAKPFHARWAQRQSGDPTSEAFWQVNPLQASSQAANKPAAGRGREHYEIATDRLANESAKATIRRQPMMFAWSCCVRVAWLWAWWPAENNGSRTMRVAIGVWYAVIDVLAVIGLLLSARDVFVRQRWMWMPGVLLALSLTLVHSVYWSNMRMRAPAMPLVYMLAVQGAWFCLRNRAVRRDLHTASAESLGPEAA